MPNREYWRNPQQELRGNRQDETLGSENNLAGFFISWQNSRRKLPNLSGSSHLYRFTIFFLKTSCNLSRRTLRSIELSVGTKFSRHQYRPKNHPFLLRILPAFLTRVSILIPSWNIFSRYRPGKYPMNPFDGSIVDSFC